MLERFGVDGCCCEEVVTCLLTEDNFDRADSSDINAGSPCGWTEQSGSTLQILGNEVSGSGTARCDFPKVLNPQLVRITGIVKFVLTNASIRVIYSWNDSDNYDCIEWTHLDGLLRVRIITRRTGSETVRGEAGEYHTLDANQYFQFCCSWDGAVVGDSVTTYLSSIAEPTFTLPYRVSFTPANPNPKTGYAGFRLTSTKMDDWKLWKTAVDMEGCPPCYSCIAGDVLEDFTSGAILSTDPPKYTGQWEQPTPVPGSEFRIIDGLLKSDITSGGVWRCWRHQAWDGFSVSVQITIPYIATTYPPEQVKSASIYLSNSQLIGADVKWENILGVRKYRWNAYYDYLPGVDLATDFIAGDTVKMTALRTATANRYELKWYINNVEKLALTHTVTHAWDTITTDNVVIGNAYLEAHFDDFHFISNATV